MWTGEADVAWPAGMPFRVRLTRSAAHHPELSPLRVWKYRQMEQNRQINRAEGSGHSSRVILLLDKNKNDMRS